MLKKTGLIMLEIISLLFVFLFVYAALNKLADLEKFRIQIGQSPLLAPFSKLTALIIPCIEIVFAVLLIIPKYRLKGLYLSYGLMVMFTAYIIAILNYSGHIPCACGGIISNLSWKEHLVFNIVFVVLGILAVLLESSNKSFIAINQDKPKTCITE